MDKEDYNGAYCACAIRFGLEKKMAGMMMLPTGRVEVLKVIKGAVADPKPFILLYNHSVSLCKDIIIPKLQPMF